MSNKESASREDYPSNALHQLSLEDQTKDVYSQQTSQEVTSAYSATISSAAPHPRAFTRYRSKREAHPVEHNFARHEDTTAAADASAGLKKSMSRYRRTRPQQLPSSAVIPDKPSSSSGRETQSSNIKSIKDPFEGNSQHKSGLETTRSPKITTPESIQNRSGLPSSRPSASRVVTRSDTKTTHSAPPPNPPGVTHTSQSPRSSGSTLSSNSPLSSRSLRSSEEPVRGLIAQAHNADPSFNVSTASSTGPTYTRSTSCDPRSTSGAIARSMTQRSQREGTPLLDLTTESTFAKGSLLRGVEQREEEDRCKEEARREAWKARRI